MHAAHSLLRHFREQLLAASLKPANALAGQRFCSNFREQLLAASLKPANALAGQRFCSNFREQLLAASLKPPVATATFSPANYFREQLLAASLKRFGPALGEPGPAAFPRAAARGLIEATATLSGTTLTG